MISRFLKILYGCLNENGLHRLIGSDTISKCGLIGAGVALLEEVCHGVAL